MQPRDFVLFTLGGFDGKVSGRTTMQKIVYFLSIILEKDLGYNPHYYGPYSANVSEAISELKALSYLNEDSNFYGFNHQGFEITKYEYSLTEDGKKLLERKRKTHPEEWAKISGAIKKIKSAGNMNYMELAMAAKAFLILEREGGSASKKTIESKAKKLGWAIDENEIEQAINFLEKIELTSWKN